MTEYWVSKQSYLCKYCDIYIRDDAPSKAQHENGLRHKGNLERYIRDIYKKEDRLQKERADEAQQVFKINEAARLAHQHKDLPGGPSDSTPLKPGGEEKTSGDEGSEARKKMKYSKQDWKGAEDLQNYSDARSLGLVDADAEIEAAREAEVEKELRATEGRVGQWEAVVKVQPVKNYEKCNQPKKNDQQQKLFSKLSNDRDPDKKPIGKLFIERSLEDDSEHDALQKMEIKLKVDRRRQAEKVEDIPDCSLHGSMRPIRLDGLHEDELVEKDDSSLDLSHSLRNNLTDDQDIKPKVEELEACTPAESTILFKKRKFNHSKPRQKS